MPAWGGQSAEKPAVHKNSLVFHDKWCDALCKSVCLPHFTHTIRTPSSTNTRDEKREGARRSAVANSQLPEVRLSPITKQKGETNAGLGAPSPRRGLDQRCSLQLLQRLKLESHRDPRSGDCEDDLAGRARAGRAQEHLYTEPSKPFCQGWCA